MVSGTRRSTGRLSGLVPVARATPAKEYATAGDTQSVKNAALSYIEFVALPSKK